MKRIFDLLFSLILLILIIPLLIIIAIIITIVRAGGQNSQEVDYQEETRLLGQEQVQLEDHR